jgi:enoyl-CoA hydratase/carnithine racemase
LAVRESLGIARRAAELDEASFWQESDKVRDLVFSSKDAQEGPRAFLEKREPIWVSR